MGVVLVCGDAYFMKILNQISIGSDKIIFKKGGGVDSFGPYAAF